MYVYKKNSLASKRCLPTKTKKGFENIENPNEMY